MASLTIVSRNQITKNTHNDYLIIIILIIKDHRPGSRVPAGPFDAGVARIQAIASFAHQGFVGLYFDHDHHHHHY